MSIIAHGALGLAAVLFLCFLTRPLRARKRNVREILAEQNLRDCEPPRGRDCE